MGINTHFPTLRSQLFDITIVIKPDETNEIRDNCNVDLAIEVCCCENNKL